MDNETKDKLMLLIIIILSCVLGFLIGWDTPKANTKHETIEVFKTSNNIKFVECINAIEYNGTYKNQYVFNCYKKHFKN